MRTLIVYESMFGNTQAIAEAIADGVSAYSTVEMQEVSKAPVPLPADLDLLIVGAPTHAFGLSRPETRRSAGEQAPGGLVSSGIGVREWLSRLRAGSHLVPAAAFDTKLSKPAWLPGAAARGINKRLRRLGHLLAAVPQSFYVDGVAGPLGDGETGRAREWGRVLGEIRSQSRDATPASR